MKRTLTYIAAAAMALGLTACSSSASTDHYYASPQDVTMEKLIEKNTPRKILEEVTAFSTSTDYEGTGNASTDSATVTSAFKKTDQHIAMNQMADYEDGSYTHLYLNDDPDDAYLYVNSSAGNQVSSLTTDEIDSLMSVSMRGYENYETTIESAQEEDGRYILVIQASLDGENALTDTITVDPATGYILEARGSYAKGASDTVIFTYDENTVIDETPKTLNVESDPSNNNSSSTAEATGKLNFNTTDINGDPVTMEDFKDANLIMVNFWEPWCGPCINEMPDLNELYEAYKGDGLVILGVFSDTSAEEDDKSTIADIGITYPILHCDQNLTQFTTDYVPTTIFADAEGNILSSEPVVGAQTSEDWERLITAYLHR